MLIGSFTRNQLVLSFVLKAFEREFWIDYKNKLNDLMITQDSLF